MEPKLFTVDEYTHVWYVPVIGREISRNNYTSFMWHKLDGPAYEDTDENEIEYWEYNQLHRYDGPASYKFKGNYRCDWFIRGNKIKEKEYKKWIVEMGMSFIKLTPEDKLLIELRWGPNNTNDTDNTLL